jgi:hypothetical protein
MQVQAEESNTDSPNGSRDSMDSKGCPWRHDFNSGGCVVQGVQTGAGSGEELQVHTEPAVLQGHQAEAGAGGHPERRPGHAGHVPGQTGRYALVGTWTDDRACIYRCLCQCTKQ